MKMIFRTVAVTAFLISNLCAYAQDTISLSLDSAIHYASQKNKTLINARYNSQKSREKVRETVATGLPQAEAGVSYNNYLGAEAEINLSEAAQPAVIKFNPTSNFTFTANQLVFSGNYIIGLQIAKLVNQSSELSYQKTELEVKEQVTRAYFLVLVSERTVKIMEANKMNTQLIFEKTNNLAKAGMIEQTDADKLSVMVISIENSQKAAERQLEMAFNMLRLQLGLDANAKIKLITSLDEVSRQDRIASTLSGSFTLDNNFDYKLMTLQEQTSKKQIALERASYLPSLVGFYSYTEKLLKPKFDMTPKNVVGLNLKIPLFSSGVRRAKVSQSKLNLLMTETSKDLLSQQLEIQEKQLRFNLNNLLEQYNNQKMNVEVAKEIYKKMSLKYEQGVVSSLELTSANNNYLSAESNFTNILFQLLDAEIALRKLNGTI